MNEKTWCKENIKQEELKEYKQEELKEFLEKFKGNFGLIWTDSYIAEPACPKIHTSF